MITITRHVCIDFIQTKHFLVVKFGMGYEKIWAFLWYQNLQKFEKKVEKSYWVPSGNKDKFMKFSWKYLLLYCADVEVDPPPSLGKLLTQV